MSFNLKLDAGRFVSMSFDPEFLLAEWSLLQFRPGRPVFDPELSEVSAGGLWSSMCDLCDAAFRCGTPIGSRLDSRSLFSWLGAGGRLSV